MKIYYGKNSLFFCSIFVLHNQKVKIILRMLMMLYIHWLPDAAAVSCIPVMAFFQFSLPFSEICNKKQVKSSNDECSLLFENMISFLTEPNWTEMKWSDMKHRHITKLRRALNFQIHGSYANWIFFLSPPMRHPPITHSFALSNYHSQFIPLKGSGYENHNWQFFTWGSTENILWGMLSITKVIKVVKPKLINHLSHPFHSPVYV